MMQGAFWNSLSHAVVIDLRGPEADDGVDDRCRVHRGEAVDEGDQDGVLLTVVATKKNIKADRVRRNVEENVENVPVYRFTHWIEL